MTIQCCKCKKVLVNDEWVVGGDSPRADISHTYCPVCLESTVLELRAEAHELASDRSYQVAHRSLALACRLSER